VSRNEATRIIAASDFLWHHSFTFKEDVRGFSQRSSVNTLIAVNDNKD